MKLKQVGILFDRDGTINTEIDLLRKHKELELIPRPVEAIREANESDLKVLIITNQSGIARGFLAEDDLAAVHKRLADLLKKRHAHVDAIHCCPHRLEHGKTPYNIACQCRKPDIGMLKKAEIEFILDLNKFYAIGDRCVEAKAGKKSRVHNFSRPHRLWYD